MREKLVAGFYGALSWVVWAVTLSGIFFLFFLLGTGHLHRSTVDQQGEAVLSPAAADDAVLAEQGEPAAGWYVLSVPIEFRGSDWSPYDYYSEEGFELLAPSSLLWREQMIVTSEPIFFSRAKPQAVTLSFYVKYSGSAESLAKLLDGAEFELLNLTQRLGFLSGEIRRVPGFTLADVRVDAPETAA